MKNIREKIALVLELNNTVEISLGAEVKEDVPLLVHDVGKTSLMFEDEFE